MVTTFVESMTKIDNFAQQYPEIGTHIKNLSEDGFIVNCYRGGISIHIPDTNRRLVLTAEHLEDLVNGKLLSGIPGLLYHRDVGISFKSYSEFFLNIKHPEYSFLDVNSEWPADRPLQFKINDVLISVGVASSFLVLLTESHFMDRDIHQDGFLPFASIRIAGAGKNNVKNYFHKALYYLNSHYLKPLGLFACLHHVDFEFDDPLGLAYGIDDPKDTFKRITRRRIRKRVDFINHEPLVLYNYATTIHAQEAFIAFYRVIEFFFMRSVLSTIQTLRDNRNATAQDIFDTIIGKNEEKRLSQLLCNILSDSDKKKLSQYAKWKGLIERASFPNLCKNLYAFRNSIVHAKENKLDKTALPDPFATFSQVEPWVYIVRLCAEQAIKKLNT